MRTLIACVVVVAITMAVPSSLAHSPFLRIEINHRILNSEFIDIGQPGLSAGDVTVRRWRLSDRFGRQIGYAHENCRLTSDTTHLCAGAYALPTGTITFQGMMGRPMAVTGGTGEYVDASGQVFRRGRIVVISSG